MPIQPPSPASVAHLNASRGQASGQAGSHIGRLLGLLGRLILYGHDLADRLCQAASTPAFARLAIPFGAKDLAAIFRRITRGLMLATALHERLERRAARGRDITPTPLRLPSLPKSATPCPHARRPRPLAAPDVVALPTSEEIAALLRHRPLGAVIVDICHDLGIMPGDVDPELWRELSAAIIEYGGSLARYLAGTMDRVFGPLHYSLSPCGREPGRGGRGAGIETPAVAAATGPPEAPAVMAAA